MSTADHQGDHVWVRTPVGTRCAFMFCNAHPATGAITPMDAAIWLGIGFMVLLAAYRLRKLVFYGPT